MIGDVNWFCDFIGIKLHWYQKLMLHLLYKDDIERMRFLFVRSQILQIGREYIERSRLYETEERCTAVFRDDP